MSRIAHILKELSRNLYRNPGTALGSFLSLTLLFLLFDLYWIAAGSSERFYTRLLSELKMEVFISEETADSTLPATNVSLLIVTRGLEDASVITALSVGARRFCHCITTEKVSP